MGRSPSAREKLTFDRQTLLARLASNGIAADDQVEFSGADAVIVESDGAGIGIEPLLRAAREFLARNHPGPDGCVWQLAQEPADLSLPSLKNATYQPRLAKSPGPNMVRLAVAVSRDGEQMAVVELTFKAQYPVRQAVAAMDIPAGCQLTNENVRVDTVLRDLRSEDAFASPVGQTAAQSMPAGTVIRVSMLKVSRPTPVVRKDQGVTMRVRGPGFTVSGIGKAMEDGKIGDLIKVRNVDSDRVVLAKVAPDGAVEPLVSEVRK